MHRPEPMPAIWTGYHGLKLVVLRRIGHEIAGNARAKIDLIFVGPPV